MYRAPSQLYAFEFGWSYFPQDLLGLLGHAVVVYLCKYAAPSVPVRTALAGVVALVSYAGLILLFRGVSLSEFDLLIKQAKHYFFRILKGGVA